MSMITLNGKLLNTFKQPPRKDSEDPEKDKIQILGDVVLPNGETRRELITITVKNADHFHSHIDEDISVPVGAFAPQKGQVIFFAI